MRLKTLILLLIFTQTINATTIDNINLWIQEDGYSLIEQKLTLDTNKYTLETPYSIRDLSIASKRGPLKYNISETEQTTIISFNLRKNLEEGETEEVFIKYGTHGLTTKVDGVWHIEYESKATPRVTIVDVNFPVGSKISKLEPESLLRTPEQYAYILYPWVEDFWFKTNYEYSATSTTTTLRTQSNQNTTQKDPKGPLTIGKTEFYLLFSLLFLTLFSVVFLIYRRRKEDSGPLTYTMDNGLSGTLVSTKHDPEVQSSTNVGGKIKESVINMLDETEIDIIRLLENSEEEEITQAYIYKTTGIPKSTLSEKLKQLEKRKIVYRSREGRTNWIKLQEWIF